MAKAILRIKGMDCPADLVSGMKSLRGVKKVSQIRPRVMMINYDSKKISSGKIFGLAKKWVYGEGITINEEFTYYTKGPKQRSYEIFLEKKLKKSEDKSRAGEVVLEYENMEATKKEFKAELKNLGFSKIFRKNFRQWIAQPGKLVFFVFFLTISIVAVLSVSAVFLTKKGEADSAVSVHEAVLSGSQCLPPPTRVPLY